VRSAYWPDERVVTATLGSIADVAARAAIAPPATLVIGDVVSVREQVMALGAREREVVAP